MVFPFAGKNNREVSRFAPFSMSATRLATITLKAAMLAVETGLAGGDLTFRGFTATPWRYILKSRCGPVLPT